MGDNHMVNIYVKDLIKKCDGKIFCGNEDEVIGECFVDSRLNMDGGTFFGIKGNKVDGSLFYKEALDNGAKVCVVSAIKDFDFEYKDKTIVIVKDPYEALVLMAKYKRELFKGKVIGITGSVGKTSTKEMIASVLEKKYKVLKTKENQNSQIGLPLTILRLKDEDVMLLEMGMSKKGEMHKLSMIAKPNIAIITNVLTSHIGNLGTRREILKAKLEILDGMKNKALIINNDNDMLSNWYESLANKENIITYGIDKGDFRAVNIKEGIKTTFDVENLLDVSVLGGKAFIYNALASILTGMIFGVSNAKIKDGINNYVNIPHRLELINLKNIKLIDDTYNASYDSVKAALLYMSLFSGKKVVILSDILELGEDAKKIHDSLGKEIVKNEVDFLVTIGKYTKKTMRKTRKLGMKRKSQKHFKNELKSRKFVRKLANKYDVMLIKGSNGFKLVNLVNYLKNKEGLIS